MVLPIVSQEYLKKKVSLLSGEVILPMLLGKYISYIFLSYYLIKALNKPLKINLILNIKFIL